LADDTPELNDGHVVTDSRDEDTDVDSTAIESRDEAPVEGVLPATTTNTADSYPHRQRTRHQRRRWPWVVAILVLLGLLTTSAVLTYQAREISDDWSDQVDAATATSYDLGQQVADEQAENLDLNAQIDLLEEQLSNSKDTVLKLSDEKAQWRDDTEFAQQQVEASEEMVTRATAVANGLQRCTDGQVELLEYVTVTDTEAEDYDPAELAAYRASVTELCAKAESANEELQKALAE
jgi:hypothetical protein